MGCQEGEPRWSLSGYGGTKPSYLVTRQGDGSVVVPVYHSNESVRALVQRVVGYPGDRVPREAHYRTSANSALRWLGDVVGDHRDALQQGKVRFVLAAMPVSATAAVPTSSTERGTWAEPGITDRALMERSGVAPVAQMNQICR